MSSNYDFDRLYIGGRWVAASSSGQLPVRSPSTEQIVGRVPAASAEDMDHAVKAARHAFDRSDWPALASTERARFVDAIADGIARRRNDFADVFAHESGQPVAKAGLPGADRAVRVFRYYASLVRTYAFEEAITGLDNPFVLRKEPVGVVAIVTPWNSPLSIASFSVPAALIAGCTVVLKPAAESPLHAQLLAQVVDEAGLPPGVFNVVPAEREASEALVRHPGVDKVTFTGSTATGRRVAALCGENLKRFSLELGGKSAAILLDDVDLKASIPAIVGTSVMNSGEACVGQTRILVPAARYAEIADAFAAELSGKKLGDPHQPDTDLGPLISERQRARVEGYIACGRDEGAKLMLGGGRPKHLTRGWYVEPTLFADCNNRMRIAREEIFGPVVCLIPYEGVDAAVAIANDSDYGLSGTVWTADVSRGLDVARRVRTGNFGINMFNLDIAAPFGGFKESGIGRQLGPQGLEQYLEAKAIQLRSVEALKVGSRAAS
jgi:betaine-aldehyde dehydrogenase